MYVHNIPTENSNHPCWCFIPSSASGRIMRLAIFRARDVLLQLRGLAIAETGSGGAPVR